MAHLSGYPIRPGGLPTGKVVTKPPRKRAGFAIPPGGLPTGKVVTRKPRKATPTKLGAINRAVRGRRRRKRGGGQTIGEMGITMKAKRAARGKKQAALSQRQARSLSQRRRRALREERAARKK